MSRNRLLLIGGFILTLAIITLGIIGLFSGNNSASQTSSVNAAPVAPVLTDSGLIIDNFKKDTSINNTSTETSIESAISGHISTRVTLAGVVRTNSLKVTTSGTAKETRFIVDIPTIKQSYIASLGEDSQTGESSLYILCPTAQEMIYPSFNCQDNTQ